VSTPCEPALDAAVIEELRALGEGDDGFLSDLIAAFVSTAPRQLVAVRAAVLSGDATAVLLAAHTLKGSCRSMGAHGVVPPCQAIETGAARGEIPALEALQPVERELARACAALEALYPAPAE
jgi:HPt (histidine-containing phosphotransfer) domain-containing protein